MNPRDAIAQITGAPRVHDAASDASRQRLLRGFAATAVAPLTGIIAQVISVPVFLTFWGAKLYGEWLILSAIATYLNLSEMGFGSVAGSEMTMQVAAGDRRRALKTFQSTWLVLLAISMAVAATVFVAVEFLPFATWLRIHLISQGDVCRITVLLTAAVLLNLQCNLAAFAFRCEGMYALGVFWLNFARFLEAIAIIVVVLAGGTPVTVAVVYCISRGATVCFLTILLHARIPWIRPGIRFASLKCARRLLGPAFAFMAFPVGNAISTQGLVVVIGLLLDPVSVVIFTILRTLTRFAVQVVGTVSNTVWPELSIAFGNGGVEKARQLHRRACQFSLWLASMTAAGLAVCGGPVYAVWVAGKVPMDYPLFCLLLVGVIASSFWNTSSMASVACNAHHRIALAYICGAALSVALTVILIPYLELRAPAVALLIIDIVMIAVVVQDSVHILGDNVAHVVRAAVTVPPVLSLARSVMQGARR